MGLDRIIDNKFPVEKAIITASYNDYGDVEAYVREMVENEREKGNFYNNHLIVRNKTDYLFNEKFLYPIAGVPAIVWVEVNVNMSRLKKNVVVGSPELEIVHNRFLDVYNPDKEFIFVDEGKDWNLANTIERGRDVLMPSDDELSLLLPGDLPFWYNIDQVLRDKHARNYDAVLNLNTKERAGKYWPRNYHFRTRSWDRRLRMKTLHFKEANLFLFNLNKLDLDVINTFYGARKAYTDHDTEKENLEKGQAYLLYECFVKDGKWMETLSKLDKRVIPRLVIKALGHAQEKIMMRLSKGDPTLNKQVLEYSLKPIAKIIDYLDSKPPVLNLTLLENMISMAFNMKFKIKADNHDPATPEDMDSLEDWCIMNAMYQIAKDPSDIHPYFWKIQEFRKVMPELEKEVELYHDFPGFMNEQCELYGLVNGTYYPDKTPFLAKPPYDKNGNLDIVFTSPEVEKMVRKNIKYHKNYKKRKWKKSQKKSKKFFSQIQAKAA